MTITNIADERARKRFVDEFKRLGWRVTFAANGAMPAELFTLYLCEYETNKSFVVKFSRPDLKQLRSWWKASGIPYAEICGFFGMIYTELLQENFAPGLPNVELLALAASTYIIGTQSYQMAESQGIKVDRFIIIKLHDHSCNEPMLRPAIPMTELSPEELGEQITMILTQDKARHPRRFASAEILPFKPRVQTITPLGNQ